MGGRRAGVVRMPVGIVVCGSTASAHEFCVLVCRYSCCQGYICPSCTSACPREPAPLCLCLESCLCEGLAISATRIYLQFEREIVTDPCDNRLIRFNNFMQILRCICHILAAIDDNFEVRRGWPRQRLRRRSCSHARVVGHCQHCRHSCRPRVLLRQRLYAGADAPRAHQAPDQERLLSLGTSSGARVRRRTYLPLASVRPPPVPSPLFRPLGDTREVNEMVQQLW